jgi:DNA invertase Pin-like site-specific DNA recombinase
MTTTTPRAALGYVRLSDLRADDLDLNGHAPSLEDQSRRIHEWAQHRGWTLAAVLVENDLTRDGKPKPASAFKRRKVQLTDGRSEYRTYRPVFRAALDRLSSGAADGFVALDLDRACRDPRDLEDMIDVAERHRVPVEAVTGSLRLSTDADVTMARIMVAVANKESRDKSRRVSASRERRAVAGKFGGGSRPYGFEPDGLTRREAECKVITDCAQAVVLGGSLRGLARDLRDRGVPTVTGRPWSAPTLRDVLLRERNAGRMVNRGEVIGRAPWEPVIPGDIHDQVVRILTGDGRDTRAGTAPRWLLSGLAECGICGGRMDVTLGGRAARYRCREHNHLARSAHHLDEHTIAVVLGWITRDAATVLVAPTGPGPDVVGLRAERGSVEANLATIGGDIALGMLTRAAGHDATRRGRARIAAIDRELASAAGPDPTLAELVAAVDPRAVWDKLPLEHRRRVVRLLVNVRILPTTKRGRGFDADAVEITPAGA